MAFQCIGEIVESVQAADTREDAIRIIRSQEHNGPFMLFLEYRFRPDMKFFQFPENSPIHSLQSSGMPYGRGSSLYAKMRRISFMIYEEGRNYPLDRMEKMLYQIAENLPGIETDLLKSLMTRDPIDGLDEELVWEAFPDDARFRPKGWTAPEPVPEVEEAPVAPVVVEVAAEETPVVAEIAPEPVTEPVAEEDPQTDPQTEPEAPVKRGPGRPRKTPEPTDTQTDETSEETDGPA